MKKRLPFILGAILVTLLIFANSLKSAELSGADSGLVALIISNILGFFRMPPVSAAFVRKAAHIFEFAVQAVMIAGCFGIKYKNRVIYILFLGLLTACFDEYIQLFSPGRAGMVRDIFVDYTGTMIGAAAGALIYGFRRG